MLIHAKNTIGMNVIETMDLKKIGAAENILIDPENGAILAFLLEKESIFSKQKMVSAKDIADFYVDGILVKNSESIINIDEVIKVKEIFKKNIFLLGSNVITQKGQYLGKIEDFIFDSNINYLVTIVVKKRFSQEKRIISADRIISILRGRVVIRDIIERVKFRELQKIGGLASVVK